MRVVEPGLLTTVQDLGRVGHQRNGVTTSGAMDPAALRIANWLVGNDEDAAGLEMTLEGPQIEFREDALIAVCGADLSPEIADLPLPTWCRIFVQRGSVLRFIKARWGCRAYLAISGGIDVPEVMGSRSTYMRARLGGIEGRPLQAGDDVPAGRLSGGTRNVLVEAAASLGPLPFALSECQVTPKDTRDIYDEARSIHVLRGPQFDLFDERDREAFLSEAFAVSPRSDRMGYRLSGPLLDSSKRDEMISSAVLGGTIQVPPDGEPIVLMADRQTTGGYPIIAQVATADLPRVAQLKPGDEIRFEESTIERTQSALRAQRDRLLSLKRKVELHGSD